MSTTTTHGGKRARGDGDGDARVRYSDMSPQQKLQRRRDERQEKKELARTLAYFTSVHRALQEQTSGGSGDAGALASLIDGFFTELLKRLRADAAQLRLLRNGAVCRAIEAALANALLLQSKSLLYVLLGHMYDLVTSPVASHTVEVLVVSLTHGLAALQQDAPADFVCEMDEHGAGAHAGSGVGSTASLLAAAVEELCERADALLTHDVGAQTLRSLVLALGGYSIRGAPALAQPVVFTRLLDALAVSVTTALRRVHADTKRPRRLQHSNNDDDNDDNDDNDDDDDNAAAAMWLAALRTPSSSFVLQSLLRVCVRGTRVDARVRVPLERLRWCSEPLLLHALRDRVAVHTFQAYVAAPTPSDVIAYGDELALQSQRQHTSASASALRGGGASSKATRALLRSLADTTSSHATQQHDDNDSTTTSSHNNNDDDDSDDDACATADERAQWRRLLRGCCWGHALRLVQRELRGKWCDDNKRQRNNNNNNDDDDKAMQAMGYVLHDLALYAPSESHMRVLWCCVLQPRLRRLVTTPALSVALTAFVRKCAFGSAAVAGAVSEATDGLAAAATAKASVDGNSTPTAATTTATSAVSTLWRVPADVQVQLRHDAARHVRYVDTSVSLQRDVCDALCAAMQSCSARGALDHLVVRAALEQRGYELARYLLHLHPTASVSLQQSIERLRTNEVVQLAQSSKGSLLLQQLLRAAALHGDLTRPRGDHAAAAATTAAAAAAASAAATATAARAGTDETRVSWLVARTLHRLLPHLRTLVYDKCGGYVVEALYDVSNVQIKEELLRALTPLYHELRKSSSSSSSSDDGGSDDKKNGHDGDGGDGAHDGDATAAAADNTQLQRHVARKVLTHCCIEQYVHRPQDWTKLAERQWQVQRLVRRILLQL